MMLSLLGAGIQCLWAWNRDAWDARGSATTNASPRTTSCSVIVCCHNESKHIERLHARLSKAVSRALGMGQLVEVLAVNHGSTDDTLQGFSTWRRTTQHGGLSTLNAPAQARKKPWPLGLTKPKAKSFC